MCIANVMVKNVVDAIVSINGTQGAANKIELLGSVMGNGGVRMLQICDKNQPHIHKHVGHKVVLCDVCEAKLCRERTQDSQGSDNADIRHDNVPIIAGRKHRGLGVVMVGTGAVPLTGDVDGEIGPPADSDHLKDAEKVAKRGLLESVLNGKAILPDTILQGNTVCMIILCLRSRDENLVVVHVICVLMMLPMRNTPRMIRDKERAMKNEAKKIVDGLPRRKGLVSALVSEHPYTSGDGTLPPPVEGKDDVGDEPARDGEGWGGVVVDPQHGEEEKGDQKEILEEVFERGEQRAFETVRRDGRS